MSNYIQIDLHEFAALMGYTNVRSAGNTFSRLRKAHGLKVEGYMTRAKVRISLPLVRLLRS